MSIYHELAKNLLKSESFIETLSDTLALELEKQMTSVAGGDRLYIHKVGGQNARSARDEQIRAAFTGNNLDELAKQHNLTPRQVRRIVNKK